MILSFSDRGWDGLVFLVRVAINHTIPTEMRTSPMLIADRMGNHSGSRNISEKIHSLVSAVCKIMSFENPYRLPMGIPDGYAPGARSLTTSGLIGIKPPFRKITRELKANPSPRRGNPGSETFRAMNANKRTFETIKIMITKESENLACKGDIYKTRIWGNMAIMTKPNSRNLG